MVIRSKCLPVKKCLILLFTFVLALSAQASRGYDYTKLARTVHDDFIQENDFKDTCYKALNPQVITITYYKGHKGKPVKEKALSAKVTFTSYELHLRDVVFRVKSKTLLFKTMASLYMEKPEIRYTVDCDGGGTSFEKTKEGLLIANSKLMAGEIKTGEDCVEGTIDYKDLKLKKIACK